MDNGQGKVFGVYRISMLLLFSEKILSIPKLLSQHF